jgi:hypothetical protein
MIFGRVQRGEILEVGLDLGAVGDLEADRAEQAFDAFERPGDRMQTAARCPRPGRVTSSDSSARRAFSAIFRIASRRALRALSTAPWRD